MAEKQKLTIQQDIDLALQHHTSGDLLKAEGIYQQILQVDPNQPVALHLLGVIAHQVGKNDLSVDLITKALAIKPDYAEAHSNLGNTLRELGKLNEAAVSCSKAIAIKPDHAEAYSNLGIVLQAVGQSDEAVSSYNKALTIKPDFAEAYNNLGAVLEELGKFDEAVTSYNKAIAIKPDYADAHSNLGNALRELGQFNVSVASYGRALEIMPENIKASVALCQALYTLSRKNFDRAQELALNFTEAFPNNDILGRGVSGITKVVNYSTESERLYTSCLFDNFAKGFDTTLEKLDYNMPEQLSQAARVFDGRTDLDVLDAGCGTGLCGPYLRARARRLIGVDLSANMLAKAREKKLYDGLVEADLVSFMENEPTRFDLVLSADVLVYIGNIAPLAQAAYTSLRPGGVCAVSVESLNDNAVSPFLLTPSGRYQHTSQYIHETFTASGFTIDPLQKTTVRLENKKPVSAWIVLACK